MNLQTNYTFIYIWQTFSPDPGKIRLNRFIRFLILIFFNLDENGLNNLYIYIIYLDNSNVINKIKSRERIYIKNKT